MAEEWGLAGGVLLICAFGAVIRWGMRVSNNAPDAVRSARRGGPLGHDLFLCRDQFDDGHGPGAGGRRALPSSASAARR